VRRDSRVFMPGLSPGRRTAASAGRGNEAQAAARSISISMTLRSDAT
jgi:hypothetical protein